MTSRFTLFAAAVFVALAGCADNGPIAPADDNPLLKDGRKSYIVVFNGDVTSTRVPDVASDMAKLHAADLGHTYQHSIRGFAARMTAADATALAKDSRVAYIVEDGVVTLNLPVEDEGKPGGSGGKTPTQKVSWGLAWVNGPSSSTTSHKAWIIDTGIDLDHPDLNVDVANSISCISNTSPDDGNGHGTHVAGIIGAINNTSGTLGVVPGATVVAVRVLGANGSGYWSDVIEGIDYVAGKASSGDVANLSLGGGVVTAVDDAVVALAGKGINVAIAAGNESDDAENHSPARAEASGIYTVSAYGSGGCFASFSNYGSHVDFAAPGVNIPSLWLRGGTKTLSGTSMAAPHVAGILLLKSPATNGTVCSDPDGDADPRASL